MKVTQIDQFINPHNPPSIFSGKFNHMTKGHLLSEKGVGRTTISTQGSLGLNLRSADNSSQLLLQEEARQSP